MALDGDHQELGVYQVDADLCHKEQRVDEDGSHVTPFLNRIPRVRNVLDGRVKKSDCSGCQVNRNLKYLE